MKNILYIVNPVSGKGRGSKVISLINESHNSKQINYRIIETKNKLHATEIASHNSKDYDIIVAVGGDGTVNEVVNGLLAAQSNCFFGVLPVGSGNDFSKNISLPKNIKDILSLYCDEKAHRIIVSDVGIIKLIDNEDNIEKKHYFINGLGIGFDAYVAYLNQNNKTLSGISSYILAVFKALLNYRMLHVKISSNELNVEGKRLMLTIGNGISSGGGFYLTPKAKIDDRLLDISIFDEITRRRLLTALPMALLNKIDKVPETKMHRLEKLSIRLFEPYYVHCDGEIISENLVSAEISISEKKLNVISAKE